jgi:hypothetical protein
MGRFFKAPIYSTLAKGRVLPRIMENMPLFLPPNRAGQRVEISVARNFEKRGI